MEWHTPIIPGTQEAELADYEFGASLGKIMRLCHTQENSLGRGSDVEYLPSMCKCLSFTLSKKENEKHC